MLHVLTAISPDRIDFDAAKVVRRLSRFGHEAYLVGGCVRDLLLGRQPKDFDVSTSATPFEIKRVFRNCRIIGRRFRLAHIFFGPKIIETSTFRATPENGPETDGDELLIRRDNTFGSGEEDARRRDFTINGLFYDLANDRVIDYVGGLDDLRDGRIRTIGDPRIRFQEDPVRILRAVKFAARLGFAIEYATEEAMVEFRGLIAKCSPARVLEEIYRLLATGSSVQTFELLHRTGVLAVLFPEVAALLPPPAHALSRVLVAPLRARPGATPPVAAEELPRDVDPEPLPDEAASACDPAEESEPSATDQWRDAERLVQDLLGRDPADQQTAVRWTWGHLGAIDRWLTTPESPASDGTPEDGEEADPARETPAASHSLLLGNALMGLASQALHPQQEARQAHAMLLQLIETVTDRLGVSRRDRDRLTQLLLLQRRLCQPGKRVRPTALAKRDGFAEALQLLELHHRATGLQGEALARWRRSLQPGTAPASARRRRRRRRRSPGGAEHEARHPS